MSKNQFAILVPTPRIYIRGNKEVAELMGLPNVKMVTNLVKEGYLHPRPRGKGYVFKIDECIDTARLIDNGAIIPKTN